MAHIPFEVIVGFGSGSVFWVSGPVLAPTSECYSSSVTTATDDLAVRLRTTLSQREAVTLAYFFGSRACGGARADSDLDVAVAFASGLDDYAREQERRAIVGALTDALGALGERADIVDLEKADSAVAFHAIRDGNLLWARSSADRIRVETRVARRYDDDAPKRALFRRAARDAVARMRAR